MRADCFSASCTEIVVQQAECTADGFAVERRPTERLRAAHHRSGLPRCGSDCDHSMHSQLHLKLNTK